MGCQVLLDFKVQEGQADAVRGWFRRILPDTRAFDGCIQVHMLVDQDEPLSFIVVELWDSRAHYEKYLAWRQGSGTLDEVMPLLATPPRFRFFDFCGV